MQNSAAHSVRSPPPCGGRAIACGQFSANGRNIGIEIGSCAQLWNPAALSHARFESKISTCDCPALAGEGQGGGMQQTSCVPASPSPPLPRKRGREQTECAACHECSNC